MKTWSKNGNSLFKWVLIIRSESLSGLLLGFLSILALWLANSSYQNSYQQFIHFNLNLHLKGLQLPSSLSHWINDGLMTLFFCVIGLEIKKEMIYGELSSIKHILLPIVAAVGGVICPALIFSFVNFHDVEAMKGWAIPTATDITFALAILSLFGKRLVPSLRIFLMTLAIFDDLVAIGIIALFYSHTIHTTFFIYALALVAVLAVFNHLKVKWLSIYLITGIFLWLCVLNSGVHATLAGVILGICIPAYPLNEVTLLHKLEKNLRPWVDYCIVPLFAFINTGVCLSYFNYRDLYQPLSIGIIASLILGKQIGIFSFSWFSIKLNQAQLPKGSSWGQLYGVSLLGGIGFTMSFFINGLSFENNQIEYFNLAKIAILFGSTISAVLGSYILSRTIKKDDSYSYI